jgi:hypothetical protein
MIDSARNSGQTPASSCQVIVGFVFGKLTRPAHLESIFRVLAVKLSTLHGHEGCELLKMTDQAELYRRIGRELDDLLRGATVSFQPGGPLAKMQRLALEEGRSFYIPQGSPSFIYASGRPPVEGAQVFQVNAVQYSEVRDPAIGEKSIIITPILTRGHGAGGEMVFTPRGIMTVEKKGPNAFEPTVHMEFLRAVSDNIAHVLVRLGVVASRE